MSKSARYQIHGVRLAVRADDRVASEAIDGLLRAYAAPLDPSLPGLGPHINVDLVAASDGFTPSVATDPPLISYGPVCGRRVSGAIVLTDGCSELQIDEAGAGILGVTHPQSLEAPYVFAAVLFNLALQLALRHHGLYYTHAAAVGDPSGPMLIVGNSGAGKTTLAIALVAAGLPYIGDDALFLSLSHGELSVLPFRRPAHLDRNTLELFPSLARLAQGPFERGIRLRWDLDPYAAFPGLVVERAAAPAMVVLLHSGGEAGRLEPIATTAALQGLLPQSGLVMLGGSACRPHLQALAKAVCSGAKYVFNRGRAEVAPHRLAATLRAAYEYGRTRHEVPEPALEGAN